MKEILCLIIAITIGCNSLLAQDSFYYCNGKKIVLKNELKKEMSRQTSLSSYIDEYGHKLEPTNFVSIKLKSNNDKYLLKDISKEYSLIVVEQDRFMPLWYTLKKADNNTTSIIDIANSIYETGLFEESIPELAVDGLEISYDPNVLKQWGLYNSGDSTIEKNSKEGMDISVSEAWNYATGQGVKIAIVDLGIDLQHEDLAANIYEKSYDACNDKQPSIVYGSHGTHCAGIASAVRNNGLHISGVAPDAKLMSVSFTFDHKDSISMVISRAINWAWKNGADVISCSWFSQRHPKITEAIDSALTRGRNGKGCVVIKSAGNNNGSITYPGTLPGVISVANIKSDGYRNNRSCYGDNLFISAPGTNILSTIPNNKTAFMTGTSMAAPHVAGVVALMLEKNPNLTVKEIKNILGKTAKKIEGVTFDSKKEYGTWSQYYGYGLVNAYKAVMMAIASTN